MSHQIEAIETPISDQCALVSQGIWRDAEQAEIVVEDAELGVEHPHPDQPDDRRRDDVGREEDGAGERRERPALIDEEGEGEAEHGHARER